MVKRGSRDERMDIGISDDRFISLRRALREYGKSRFDVMGGRE